MSFLLGVVIFVFALLVSVMLHEAGHFADGQEVPHEGHPVLRGLRPDPVVAACAARPSTGSRRCRSAAS